MLSKGDSYRSKAGSTITILEGPADNGGARIRFDRVMPPGKGKGEPHLHLDCAQRYEIQSGTATIEVDGNTHTLGKGEKIEVPAETGHRDPYNASDEELRFRAEIEPCPPFIDAFARGLAESYESGQLTSQDEMPLLKIFTIIHAYDGLSYRTGIPIALQKPSIPLMAAIGRLRGYRPPATD